MDQIRPWLYIGKYRDTKDEAYLRAENIDAMLLFAAPVSYDGMTSLYIPVEDGEPIPDGMLQKGIDFILEQKRNGRTLLIACGAGMSRAATYTIAALRETENLDLLEAHRQIKQARPICLPHKDLWESLCQHYNESILWRDVIHTK